MSDARPTELRFLQPLGVTLRIEVMLQSLPPSRLRATSARACSRANSVFFEAQPSLRMNSQIVLWETTIPRDISLVLIAYQSSFKTEKEWPMKAALSFQRLNNKVQQIAHMERRLQSAGRWAQVRGEIQTLKATVERNQGVVSPPLEEWKPMKTLGVGIVRLYG